MQKLKKLFGGIYLDWKKLIIFAIIAAVYTATMAIIPITKDTSFRDISITFEWWILFGIIIICNSKSKLDSALKCFVFFLISQPLIYLLQVPFSWQGWHLFSYYKYWFIWTLLTIPMGYIGYYIKNDNILSAIILLPMLIFLGILGINYFSSMLENFPFHILSCISCFAMIVLIVLGVLSKTKLRSLCFIIVIITTIGFFIYKGGISSDYETYKTLEDYNLSGDVMVSFFKGTKKGNVEVMHPGEFYTLKLNGKRSGKYEFTLRDDSDQEISFEYYYDAESKSVIINEKGTN